MVSAIITLDSYSYRSEIYLDTCDTMLRSKGSQQHCTRLKLINREKLGMS